MRPHLLRQPQTAFARLSSLGNWEVGERWVWGRVSRKEVSFREVGECLTRPSFVGVCNICMYYLLGS